MPRHVRVLLCLFALSGTLLLNAQAVHAGVIIWQEQEGGNWHDYLIEIIQGHKEWLALSTKPQDISHVMSAEVDDLDKGVRTSIYYTRKTFSVEKPFPDPVDGAGPNPFGIGELKPTGRFRKIAGYSCEEYEGSGDSAHWGHTTEVDCVSKDAPGVAEYNEFMKILNQRYLAAGYDDGSYPNNYPSFGSPRGIDGILLESTLDAVAFVVRKIEYRVIPASQFEVPAGFVRMKPSVANGSG
jgi:hypothetical protein